MGVLSVSPSVRTVGFWSALLSAAFSLFYVAAQVLEWLGVLGSQGGPESSSTPLGIGLLLTPSLLLGSAFLMTAVSVHGMVPAERRVWSHGGIAFASMYAVLTGTVYFVQLTLVAPRLARSDVAGIEAFLFVPFDSFLYAVDILGYSFMSVATLFLGMALHRSGPHRVARHLLVANGLLLPFIALQMYFHSLIWVASLWAVTFPGAMLALALGFHRAPPVMASQPG